MSSALLVANWKLNHSKKSAADFLDSIIPYISRLKQVEAVLAPVSLHLDFLVQKSAGTKMAIAAQNVFYENCGAFTGEFSAEQLAELGVLMAIVGHSERRKLFHESDEIVAKKVSACLDNGLVPIVCVGETLIERDSGKLEEVLARQCLSFTRLPLESQTLILAYEPVWAIGTGRSASAMQAEEAHALLRKILAQSWGLARAASTRILYGGSLTAQNVKEIVSMPNVDGALVGGASLQVDSFLAMLNALDD